MCGLEAEWLEYMKENLEAAERTAGYCSLLLSMLPPFNPNEPFECAVSRIVAERAKTLAVPFGVQIRNLLHDIELGDHGMAGVLQPSTTPVGHWREVVSS